MCTTTSAAGSVMRRRRESLGMGIREVGKLAGLSPSSVSYYERGTREPDLARAIRIAQALEIPLSDLLGVSEPLIVVRDSRLGRSLV